MGDPWVLLWGTLGPYCGLETGQDSACPMAVFNCQHVCFSMGCLVKTFRDRSGLCLSYGCLQLSACVFQYGLFGEDKDTMAEMT